MYGDILIISLAITKRKSIKHVFWKFFQGVLQMKDNKKNKSFSDDVEIADEWLNLKIFHLLEFNKGLRNSAF